MVRCTRKWLMRVVETIWGNDRDVLAAPDEDQHAYGILRKCCRRRCAAMAAATCCRSVQSQSHLWFSESDAGDMATALTWKLLDRFPLPSPATRPALSLDPSPAALWITLQLPIYFFFLLHLPLLGHKPALLGSSSLAVVFTEYARPRLRLIFLSRSPLSSVFSYAHLLYLLGIFHYLPLFTSHQIIFLNTWLVKQLSRDWIILF